MYNRNKIGPKTDPCGTPEESGTSTEHSPLSEYNGMLLPTRNHWIHERVLP